MGHKKPECELCTFFSVQPSDDNKKASVAASHTTTEVEDSAMQHLFEVRHLGGKYAKQRRRYYFDFRLDTRVCKKIHSSN